MTQEIPGPIGGFVAVLALSLPLAAPVVLTELRRGGSNARLIAVTFATVLAAIMLSWWLVWPALFWVNARS